MKRKALFFSSWPVSHLYPLKSLINFLKKRNIDIYILTCINNKNVIEKYLNVNFIEYPFNINCNYHQEYTDLKLELSKKYFNENRYTESYIEYLKSDISIVLNKREKDYYQLKEIVKKVNPNFIFRDSVDIYGHDISLEFNLPCIGYITNNLYSDKYFNTNPEYLYKIFMAGINYESLLKEGFFSKFYDLEVRLYDEVSRELNVDVTTPFHQFDPKEYLNVIFSTDFLQPLSSLDIYRKYDIVYPAMEQLYTEKIINSNLEKFIELSKDKKIAYVSTGSFINKEFLYYKNIIEGLLKCNYNVVMSVRDAKKELLKYFGNYMSRLYLDDYIEQKYVLSFANIFVTSGGFNSILEAIYYKVPMLVIPVSSEQRLNGLIIEEKKIGISCYTTTNLNYTFIKLIKDIENNDIILKNLEIYSNYIDERCRQNEFANLESFLDI